MKLLLALPVTAAGVAVVATLASASGAPAEVSGPDLYATQCASCHGTDGEGVPDRGPGLVQEGPAAVDFVLRTGRMPMADPTMQARRGPVRFTEEQIVALVEYAGRLGDGPLVPDVSTADADVAAGGALYRVNCAACHVASGAGAAIGGGRVAPSLMDSTPTQIGEAILIGPGAMPTFGSFSPEDIANVAAYVEVLQDGRTTSIDSFGGAGPVAEGLAAWLIGLIPIVALTRWIGSPHEGRDEGTLPAGGTP